MDEFCDIMSYAAIEKSSKNLSFVNLRSCLCLENFKYEEFLFFIAFLFAACLQMLGQELKVASFSIVANDLSASIEQKMDLNGMPCALVKVLVLDKISGVEGNIIGNAIDKGTEKWIYLTSGSKEVKIKTEKYFPLHLIFSHYGITAWKQSIPMC